VQFPRFTPRDELIARITDLTDALKKKGAPPDTTLAEALGAYAAAFPKEDDDYPLLEANVIEDGKPVVWISSPIDFDEGQANGSSKSPTIVPRITSQRLAQPSLPRKMQLKMRLSHHPRIFS